MVDASPDSRTWITQVRTGSPTCTVRIIAGCQKRCDIPDIFAPPVPKAHLTHSFSTMASTLVDSESTPLIARDNSFYFINQTKQADTTRDPDGGLVQESLPPGANPDEFAPRVLGAKVRNVVFPLLSSVFWSRILLTLFIY